MDKTFFQPKSVWTPFFFRMQSEGLTKILKAEELAKETIENARKSMKSYLFFNIY